MSAPRFVNIDVAMTYSGLSRRSLYYRMRAGTLTWKPSRGDRSRLVSLDDLPVRETYQPQSRCRWEGGSDRAY